MPLEQAVLDYRVLERIDNGEGGKMRVVVVGARRDTVEHLLAVARKAGLQPELVDLSAFAMIRALYVPPGPAAEVLAAAEVAPMPELGLDGQPIEPLHTEDEGEARHGDRHRDRGRRPPQRSTATSAGSRTLRSESPRAVSSTACCRTAWSPWPQRSPSAAV